MTDCVKPQSLVPGALSLDDLEHLVANAKDKK
jgi:hypothetical protein